MLRLRADPDMVQIGQARLRKALVYKENRRRIETAILDQLICEFSDFVGHGCPLLEPSEARSMRAFCCSPGS